jgi:hypothetical protein
MADPSLSELSVELESSDEDDDEFIMSASTPG